MRAVLTTGANSGIGLATAVELAKRGFRSVGTVRSDAKAAVVRAAAEEAGVEVETVLLDVTDALGCEHVIDTLRPWALVNNAGYGHVGAIEDVPDDEARALLETMVIAPMRLARLALRAEAERIVNVSSIYGRTNHPLTGWYQASKHALESLSDALRMETACDSVKVILIEPGGVKTALWDDVDATVEKRAGSRYQASYKRMLDMSRLSRPVMVSPEHVAKVICDALQARTPRRRYLIGLDANAQVWADRVAVVQPLRDRVARMIFNV